jgi:hypothetical protein
VYNIEVETEHCYFVGSEEVLTHNSCVTDSSRKEAFRQAKDDAGAPRSQQPDSSRTTDMTDMNNKKVIGPDGKPIPSREYTFTNNKGKQLVIQDHGAGHKFPDGGKEGSHFNVRKPEDLRHSVFSGTKSHYNFEKKKSSTRPKRR